MVLQAGAVRRVLRREPDREREVLRASRRPAARPSAELHRMLGILRKRDDGAELAPQPSLRRVDELVAAGARAPGSTRR